MEDYFCTCGSDQEEAADHSMACALWDDEEFASGHAIWSEDDQGLIYLDPGTSLHEAVEEAMAGVMGDPPEDLPLTSDADWDPPAEPKVYETFEEACQKKEETILEEWADGDVPKNYTMDGVSRVWNPDIGAWESKAMKCHCAVPDTGANLCLHCQVWRPGKENVKPGKSPYGMDHWRPLFWAESEVFCNCEPPMIWQCQTCHVKRTKESEPFQVHHSTNKSGSTTTFAPLCRHPGRPLLYPDGATLHGSSHTGTVPAGYKPDFAVYLDKIWTAETLAIQVPWPDMSVPDLADEHMIALVDLIGRMIGKGQTVEVGCIGGHGRTGTLLAMVALEHGVDTPEEAVKYVRANYCDQAIESATQEWYVAKYFAVTRGLDVPEKPKVVYSTGSSVAVGANKGKTGKKKNDTQGIWYCGLCAKDAWDQDDACFHCRATFSNAGVRPLAEWHQLWVKGHEAETKARIAKATLLAAEAGHGVTTLKVVTATDDATTKLKVRTDHLDRRVDEDGYTHATDCMCEDCKTWRGEAAIEKALDQLDSGTPHLTSRLPFSHSQAGPPTQALLGKMRLTQPLGTLSIFEHKGRTYIPTAFTCERCERRLFYKVRYANAAHCSRTELVHADDLTKITRCKGGKH